MRYYLVVLAMTLVGGNDWARAGLYYSGEAMAELPSQWRGFLLDHRALRLIAIPKSDQRSASPARIRYQQEADQLEKLAKKQDLSAKQSADLGAIYVRLGDLPRALEVLRQAQRTYADDFLILANLGTIWQLQGDYEEAERALAQAVRLAPEKYRDAEKLQLRLVRLRKRETPQSQHLDDLFGVEYVGTKGEYQPGQLAPEQRKKLPANAVALVQRLALWLPSDARILWQLAELAALHGDSRTAAAMMDGCVTEFGLRDPKLRQHRRIMRTAADRLAASGVSSSEHQGHLGRFEPKSARPLIQRIDRVPLPPIDPDGVNRLPWTIVAETTVDSRFRPSFPKHLRALDGKQVSLTGFMQPLGDDLESAAFMFIEYPVGCWYCEMPEINGIVLVEMPEEKTQTFSRDLLRATGKLHLNNNDPENFLFILRDAKVQPTK